MGIKLCVFDLDDTLIHTQELYTNRIDQAVELAGQEGFSEEDFRNKLEEIDSKNREIFGVRRERFPKSFVQTYETFCKENGINIRSDLLNRFHNLGKSVFTDFAQPVDGVYDMLSNVSDEYETVLFTAGEKDIQMRRVVEANLQNYFSSFYVKYDKTPEMFTQIKDDYNVLSEESVMIGNSLTGDLYPAMEAGFCGIHIQNGTITMDKTLQDLYGPIHVSETYNLITTEL